MNLCGVGRGSLWKSLVDIEGFKVRWNFWCERSSNAIVVSSRYICELCI